MDLIPLVSAAAPILARLDPGPVAAWLGVFVAVGSLVMSNRKQTRLLQTQVALELANRSNRLFGERPTPANEEKERPGMEAPKARPLLGLALGLANKSNRLFGERPTPETEEKQRPAKEAPKERPPLGNELLELYRDQLNFYTEIGVLLQRRALHKTTAWALYYGPVDFLYANTHAEVLKYQAARGDDWTLWEEFLWLHDKLCKVEKRIQGRVKGKRGTWQRKHRLIREDRRAGESSRRGE